MPNQSLRTNDCVDEVIEKYADMVYRLAFSRVKNKNDADDIFQEVFLRYIKKERDFETEEHRKAWLIRVTINCSNSFFSSAWSQKVVPIADTEPAPFEAPEELGLHELLMELPVKYRTVLHLFYYEDLPINEISRILKRKPATVKTQLMRARQMLKEKLKGDLYENIPCPAEIDE